MARNKKIEVRGWSRATPIGSKVFLAPHPDGDGCFIRFTDPRGKNTDVALSTHAMQALLELWAKCVQHDDASRVFKRLVVRLAAADSAAAAPPHMWAGCPPLPAAEVDEFRYLEAQGILSARGWTWADDESRQQPAMCWHNERCER